MNPAMRVLALVLVVPILFTATPSIGQAVVNRAISLADLKSVPNGNYLVTLEVEGKVRRLNLQIQGNRAKCVDSSDPKLKSIQGEFQFQENGVFVARLRGGDFGSSQIWIFRGDGAAAIREVPDRGEQQSAVAVNGTSIDSPKKK